MSDLMPQWVVTFGADHVLRGGQVQLADPELGGLPLGKFFAVLFAETAAQARARVIDVFGPGNWCDIYPLEEGLEVISPKYGLKPLFTLDAGRALGEVPICLCRTPVYPHGRGWHQDREG